MAIRFDIKEGRLTIKAETLSISAFNNIWEWDTSRGKVKAISLIKHVFHLCDITSDNQLIDMSEKDRVRLSKRDCWKDDTYKLSPKEQELFDDAARWYVTLNKGLPWRSLRVIEKKIDQINDHLDDIAVSAKNLEDTAKTVMQLDKLHQTRDNVEEIVQKQLKKMKVRGGLDRSPLEKGNLNVR